MLELWLENLFKTLWALALLWLCVAFLRLRISTPVFALGMAVVLVLQGGVGWFFAAR